jgi:hypothetical protein
MRSHDCRWIEYVLHEKAFSALNHTVAIDFTLLDGLVDSFETIIRYSYAHCVSFNGRYVGGLVSTIDLLEYGFSGPSFDSNGLAAIRKQAEILVHKLAPGFVFFFVACGV